MARPKHNPRSDENHKIVSDFVNRIQTYGGMPLACRDMSKKGGSMVDWALCLGPLTIWPEVKTPEAFASKDNGMTAGELDFFETWPAPKALIVDDADIAEMLQNWYPVAMSLQAAIERKANEQVLHSDGPGRLFTSDGWKSD